METKACYFEDYTLGDVRITGGRTITEADFVIHAGQTGDFFPHHMDAEFAKTTEFGKRIAHGTLTFSVGVGLTASFVNPVAFSYGYDHLRFVKPVFIGDTIHTEVTIHDKRDTKHPDKGMVVERLAIKNQNDEVVMVADHLLMCERREVEAVTEAEAELDGE
jgi:monoamine oxidase